MLRIRLIRKLAAVLNGVDVSNLSIGDILELPDTAAQMMIAERWAEPAPALLAIPSPSGPHAQPHPES